MISAPTRARACAGFLLAIAACGLGCMDATSSPPNIVLIIADDLRAQDLGFMGSPIVETPHLDALAASGITFANGINASSSCRPSVRALLSGLTPVQWWESVRAYEAMHPNTPGETFLADAPTLPRLLTEHGYQSFQAGKIWDAYSDAGFTDGMLAALRRPLGKQMIEVGRALMQPVEAFLDGRDDAPFFLWFAPLLPHYPFDADPADVAHYISLGASPAEAGYYANCSRLDTLVGELMDALRERELLDDTLIVFVSDNGWEVSEADTSRNLGGPLGKASFYLIGLQTPIVVRWPGHAPAGARVDTPLSTLDLAPSLLAAAGVEIPATLSGTNRLAAIEGREGIAPHPIIGAAVRIAREPGATTVDGTRGLSYFVLDPRWHYIWHRGEAECHVLLERHADPSQPIDVASMHPGETRRLRGDIEAWVRGMGVEMPGFETYLRRRRLELATPFPAPAQCPG
jgi:arylsulfatase A